MLEHKGSPGLEKTHGQNEKRHSACLSLAAVSARCVLVPVEDILHTQPSSHSGSGL